MTSANYHKINGYIVSIAFIVLGFSAQSQQATISGKIVDKSTGEELIGANVQLEGTLIGASADLSGNYSFKADPGTYNILCSYISYQPMVIKGVVLEAGKVKTMDFVMESSDLLLNEVVIEVEARKNTDASLVAMQRKSYAVQDGISSQQIQRTGSGNAAESMKQMPGANVDDGKYMVMRGLGDRYSIAQLNGLPMPSSDPYRNAASLDLIPSNFVENIVTIKTFTPDQPGNFAGGNVNITSKSFPDKFNVSLTVAPSFNTQASLNENFGTYEGGKTDRFGYDDGKRSMPSALENDSLRNLMGPAWYLDARGVKSKTNSYYNNPDVQQEVDSINANYAANRELFHSTARSFNNQFHPDKMKSPINTSYNFTIGNRFRLGEVQEIGVTAGATYSRNFTHYEDGRIATLVNVNQDSLFAYQDLNETKSIENPQVGGFANVAYKFHKHHTIGVIGIYSNDAEKVTRLQSGSYVGQVSDTRATFHTNVLEWTQREMKTIQLNGNHVFTNLLNLEIDWAASTTRSRQSEPDLRYFAYTTVIDSVDSVDQDGNFVMRYLDTLHFINNAEYAYPYHFYRELNDQVSQAKVDFTLPLNESKTNKIKVGAYVSESGRSFSEYRYQLANAGSPSEINFTQFGGDFDAFFSKDNYGIIDTVYNYNVVGGDSSKPVYDNGIQRYQTGYYYMNQVNNKNFYTGSQRIMAGYAMGIVEITKKFRFVGGARVEKTFMEVVSQNIDTLIVNETNPDDGSIVSADTVFTTGTINLTDVLPSVNFIYDLGEKAKIRLAFSQTIARPNLRELAPFEQFDTKNGFYMVGNPDLKRTVIQNYDLRYEFYPNSKDIMAVSVYYKRFQDPIVRAFNPSATIPELRFVNVDNATVYGAEFEVRKSLEFIAPAVKDFSIATNLTFTKSETPIPGEEVKNARNIDSTYSQTTRPFVGQSGYIANATLVYQNADFGHESALSFNVAGRKLYNIALFATPDVYEMPVPMLNFKTSQNIGEYIVVSLFARNLLDSKIWKTQTHRGTQYITESYKLGRTFGVGLTLRIK